MKLEVMLAAKHAFQLATTCEGAINANCWHPELGTHPALVPSEDALQLTTAWEAGWQAISCAMRRQESWALLTPNTWW